MANLGQILKQLKQNFQGNLAQSQRDFSNAGPTAARAGQMLYNTGKGLVEGTGQAALNLAGLQKAGDMQDQGQLQNSFAEGAFRQGPSNTITQNVPQFNRFTFQPSDIGNAANVAATVFPSQLSKLAAPIAPKILPRIVNPLGRSAITGAVEGALYSQANNAPLKQRPANLAAGAVFGGGLGAAHAGANAILQPAMQAIDQAVKVPSGQPAMAQFTFPGFGNGLKPLSDSELSRIIKPGDKLIKVGKDHWVHAPEGSTITYPVDKNDPFIKALNTTDRGMGQFKAQGNNKFNFQELQSQLPQVPGEYAPNAGVIAANDQIVGNQPKSPETSASGLQKIGQPAEPVFSNNPLTVVKDKLDKLYTQAIDRFHPLTKLGKQAGDEQAVQNALTAHYGAGSTADYHVNYELAPILKSADANDLRAFTVAQRDLELANRGIKGSDATAANQVLQSLNQKYGGNLAPLQETAGKLYEYQDQMVKKYLVDTGVISQEAYKAMKANNQAYVPFKRIMDTVDEHLGVVPGNKNVGSVSSQDIIKGIKGSNRQIVDPLQSIIQNTYKMVGLGQRQQVAKTLVSLRPSLPEGTITPLRTAENVQGRIDLFKEAKDLKPIQQKLQQIVQSKNSLVRKLESQLNTLNRKGLETSLQKPQLENAPQALSQIKEVATQIRNLTPSGSKKQGVVKNVLYEAKLSTSEFKQVVNNLVNLPSSEISAIKSKIATRENKLGPLLDEISGLSDALTSVKSQRMTNFDEAKLLRDAETKGKSIINVFKNGIKETYEVPQDVAEAAKGMNEDQLSTIVKILAAPTRIFRETATGVNPEFFGPNVGRDLQAAFVNAKVNPLDYVKGLAHYLKKDDIYQQFLKSGGQTSRLSLDNSAIQKTLGEITSPRGIKVTKPSDLYHLLQEAGQASEQPTRIAAFDRTLKENLAKGMAPQEAQIRAAQMAQEATTNFARRGSATKSVNAIYAFLNARAQGLDQLVRSAKKDPAGVAFRIGLITQAPALALYAYNRQYPSYFDDRVVSPTDKRNNFILMTPWLGQDRYIKIPKGDVGKLANPTEAFLSTIDGKGGNISQELGQSLKAFLPVDNAGDAIPTALRPIAENAANKNFFTGREIVPDYKKNFPPAKQDNNTTAPIYRAAGKFLNQSPARLQNFTQGYGTGFARLGEMATTPLAPAEFKKPQNQQGDQVNQTPIIRRFVGGAKQTQEEADLAGAKKLKSMQFNINDIKAGIKRGDLTPEEGMNQINKLLNQQSSLPTNTAKAAESSAFNKPVQPPKYATSKDAPQNAFQTLGLYAKGLAVDPGNTLEAITTNERLRKVTGNAAIFERQQNLNTNAKGQIVDHIVPLSLGGSNSQKNLVVQSPDQAAAKDVVEKDLYKKLQSGQLTKQQAQQQMKDWVDKNITNQNTATTSRFGSATFKQVSQPKALTDQQFKDTITRYMQSDLNRDPTPSEYQAMLKDYKQGKNLLDIQIKHIASTDEATGIKQTPQQKQDTLKFLNDAKEKSRQLAQQIYGPNLTLNQYQKVGEFVENGVPDSEILSKFKTTTSQPTINKPVDKATASYLQVFGLQNKTPYAVYKKLATDTTIPDSIKKKITDGLGIDTNQASKRYDLESQQAQLNADYALASDQSKRGNDLKSWMTAAEGKHNYLTQYLATLDPKKDQLEYTKTVNAIGDIEAQAKKYQEYGGFTKPKKGRKPVVTLGGTLSAAQYSQVKQQAADTSAQFSLQADQSKRADDLSGYLKLLATHYDTLEGQKKYVKTQAELTNLQNKQADMYAEAQKLSKQGGFTKPKIRKPKTANIRSTLRAKPVTNIKRIQTPKRATIKPRGRARIPRGY